jgi:ribonuclease T1
VTGISRLASIIRLVLLLTLTGLCGLYPAAEAREHPHDNALAWVALSDLPPEARQTLQLIQRGGPFPYPPKDGSPFGNFERQLPAQTRGYYREYTVPTPGSRDRGARRIIAGGGIRGNLAASGEYYYTDDHYRSFRRIREP